MPAKQETRAWWGRPPATQDDWRIPGRKVHLVVARIKPSGQSRFLMSRCLVTACGMEVRFVARVREPLDEEKCEKCNEAAPTHP